MLKSAAEAGLEGRIRHVMIPGMIEEDGDRPIEMKPKMDVLDFWSIIKPELPGVNGLCTQVTAFLDEPTLRKRLTVLGDTGIEGIAFVGVPRTMNDGEGSGVAPTDALSIFDQLVPNRGVILIPTREGEHGRFDFKCNRGATYGMTQLLYSDAIVDFLTEFARTTDHRPEILLSFGFVPKVETRVGLINWLIQDPGNAAVAAEQEFVKTLAATEPRTASEVDGRPLQAGHRRRRRARLPAERPLRGDLRSEHTGLRDLRRHARVLGARPVLAAPGRGGHNRDSRRSARAAFRNARLGDNATHGCGHSSRFEVGNSIFRCGGEPCGRRDCAAMNSTAGWSRYG